MRYAITMVRSILQSEWTRNGAPTRRGKPLKDPLVTIVEVAPGSLRRESVNRACRILPLWRQKLCIAKPLPRATRHLSGISHMLIFLQRWNERVTEVRFKSSTRISEYNRRLDCSIGQNREARNRGE